MSRILCAPRLWRYLRFAECPASTASQRLVHGGLLGSWASQSFRFEQRELVVAVNGRTHLTAVFPRAAHERFRADFAMALAALLDDLRLPAGVVRSETTAIEFAPYARLADRRLAAVLSDVQYFCELELMYHDDLRTVQWNLNQLPHEGIEVCVPAIAVAELYEGVRRSPSRVH